MSALIRPFFDESTKTVSYLVADPDTRECVIIDPVLDFDPRNGTVTTASADAMLAAIANEQLQLIWILETHVHADHLSAAQYLKRNSHARIGIGEHVREVQALFAGVFNLKGIAAEGRDFDALFRDGDELALGHLKIEVMHTPGHTPACVSYRIDDTVFVGDTLFMPDYGTARTDFPGGDAATLYRSIRRLLSLPPQTRLFMCHDYKTAARNQYAWESTVAQQREQNVHANDGVTESAFVEMRHSRDATLATPDLLLPSIQVNVCAGRLPQPEANGVRYLKTPLRIPDALATL
jgi:glyoxylase-like metal-dependent hydrolase (beta-lactamase superfamily II)